MNKKISAVISAIVAVVLGVCFAVSSFGFVEGAYGEDQIYALSGIGLIDARDPGDTVTRGEALRSILIATSQDAAVWGYNPDESDCPFTDLSGEMEAYVAVAYDLGIVSDMPDGEFCENRNITLPEMLLMTLRAAGYVVSESDDVYELAELAVIYKTCEADSLVFDLPYACYAEIMWNLLVSKGVGATQTFGELLVENRYMDYEAYEYACSLMTGYEFGSEHSFSTGALVRTERVESESETEKPETTAPADTTTASTTTYDTEDNSGYSPPFKP